MLFYYLCNVDSFRSEIFFVNYSYVLAWQLEQTSLYLPIFALRPQVVIHVSYRCLASNSYLEYASVARELLQHLSSRLQFYVELLERMERP